jgi:hypothetical protein
MVKYKEEGRMFSRGKVVKLRFPVTKNDCLSFFMFKGDIERLLDGEYLFAQIFLDTVEIEKSDGK